MDRKQDRTRARPTAVAAGLALLATLLIVPLVLAASVDAFVYWADSYRPDHIGRANLDGTAINREFAYMGSGHEASFFAPPDDLAIDAGHLYWTTTERRAIGRARLDGTHVDEKFITGIDIGSMIGTPGGIAVDAGHVYWGWLECSGGAPPQCTGGGIGRANLDGSGVDPHFIVGPPAVDLAVDQSKIYWMAAGDSVGRANLDGTAVEGDFITDVSPRGDLDVAVDAGHIYWTNGPDPDSLGSIGRANLDGTGVDRHFIAVPGDFELFRDPYHPADLAVDAGHIYWADSTWPYDTHPIAWIGRANLDGTPTEVIDGPANVVSAMAVDALRDTVAPNTRITKDAPDNSKGRQLKFKFKSSEPNSTFECRLDKKSFKPCSSPEKLKHLDAGKHNFRVRAIDAALNVDPSPAKDKFRRARGSR